MKDTHGFSVLEIILAGAIFVLIATTGVVMMIQALNANRLGQEQTVAVQYATEGIEAVRSIKNQAYSNVLTNPSGGVVRNGSGVWEFGGANNTFDKYTRFIQVQDAQRECSTGAIVTSGGATDPNTKKITSTVTWNFSPFRSNSVDIETYLTNWRQLINAVRGGVLVYGNGGTTSDAMAYRVLDGAAGTWSAATAMPDFDGGSTNARAVRAVRLDASPTRDEKIAIVRRYQASTTEHSIWAYVWNGSSWSSTGSPFATWTSNSNLDVRNFDGTYLSNGTYMFVYSDNTSTPKYRTWNGCTWSNQNSLVNLSNNGSGIPLYIITRVRPGTNEVMAAFFGTGRDTNTQYFNGTSWTLHSPRHSNNGPASKEMVDFAWSPNTPTTGALIYPDTNNDRNITLKVWTANGTGGGTWSSAANATNQGTLGAMNIDGRRGDNEFLTCSKDASNDIYCFKATFTPTFQTPTNNILTATTQTGIQRSYDFAFESSTGTNGLVVYSVNSNTPQRRIYTPGASPAFSTAANLLTTQLGGTLTTVRTRAFNDNDDIMVLMADSLNDLYTVVWNGTTNATYSSPAGKARSVHGTNGSATTDFWYDFIWDRF